MPKDLLRHVTTILIGLSVVFPIQAFVLQIGVKPAFAQPPQLSALDPPQGSERSVVVIHGKTLNFAKVVWDSGLPSEKEIPDSLPLEENTGQTKMFSVPVGAAEGPHPIRLKNSVGMSSETLIFTVTKPLRFGTPRIDYVTLLKSSIEAETSKFKTLYVQGANIDVGAEVKIDGTQANAIGHKVLKNKLHGIHTEVLENPIHHYLSMIVTPNSDLSFGQTLTIRVENLDCVMSEPFQYTLPSNAASVDSDGDGLLDMWETTGFDASGDGEFKEDDQNDINLKSLGADPYRRDLFVEIDVMKGLAHPPSPQTFALAKNMFNEAPIINPYGPHGINLVLHLDSEKIDKVKFIEFDVTSTSEKVDFEKLKTNEFGDKVNRPHYGKIYRYGVWASEKANLSSGGGDLTGFFITTDSLCDTVIDSACEAYHTPRSQSEILAHELGHNLDLRHGGGTSTHYKPNYWSVMSYSWALRTTWRPEKRKQFPTCTPLYYAENGAMEPNGHLPGNKLPTGIIGMINYSEGMGPILHDSNLPSEVTGVCGFPIDWNNNNHSDIGPPHEQAIQAAVFCSETTVGVVCDNVPSPAQKDFSDWRELNYSAALK